MSDEKRCETQGECKDKPAGPFEVLASSPPILYFEPSDKRAPLNIPVKFVVNLAQWLNELWPEREVDDES